MYDVEEIDREEFSNKKGINPIIDEGDTANRYAVINFNGKQYPIAWCNNGIDPEPLFLEKYQLLIIGVGETVVAISKSGMIRFCLGLTTPFSGLLENDLGFIIVSETGIIIINGFNCSINRSINVPDIIVDYSLEGEKVKVETMEGQTYDF